MVTFLMWWFGIGIVLFIIKSSSDLYEKHFQGKHSAEPYAFLTKWVLLVLGPPFLIGLGFIIFAGLIEANAAKGEEKRND